MKKSERELIAMARSEGVEHPRLTSGGRHNKLIGEIDGVSIKLPVSVTKAFSTQRWQKCTRLNIRRAVEAARA